MLAKFDFEITCCFILLCFTAPEIERLRTSYHHKTLQDPSLRSAVARGSAVLWVWYIPGGITVVLDYSIKVCARIAVILLSLAVRTGYGSESFVGEIHSRGYTCSSRLVVQQ